ncbi:MAG TPA: CDP-alcohol phosphatidyltransferase family protein, partial [Propionibacteriaceae bacterium]|nr:CDP-alcohol phosphatidyltransferase family protein [Propionibacteriaceae bacterium]
MTSEAPDVTGERGWLRSVAARMITAVAVLLVWFSLIFPDQLGRFTLGTFLRLPVEILILVALGLVLPGASRRVMATVAGLVLGLVAILKIIDMGFFFVLGQPFNPLTDMSYLKSAVGLLRDSAGPYRTVAAVVAAMLVVVAVVLLLTWSALRLTRSTAQHRSSAAWTACALGVVWLLCAALGVQVAGAPVASTSAAAFTQQEVDTTLAADDAFATVPDGALLTGLRGKDVLIVFVESYGRVAIEDSAVSPGVIDVLTRGTDSLRAAGFSSRSAFLTSPTFAGISWLAHGTLQSGLWIDSQRRYNQLLQTDRLTLSAAFKRAGWRTVAAAPANTEDWPEGASFYRYDTI